ncbi:MAG: SAM-dependent methyltransferase, partial [Nocardioidaceae bacterium]
MDSGRWTTVRHAWQDALYGAEGFYCRATPADHFRTSVHVSPLFARAVVALARRHRAEHITDWGSGAGELLVAVHELAPEMGLTGVDLRGRPRGLPPEIEWLVRLPDRVTGLLVANELLDNVACDLVELDAADVPRLVEVERAGVEQRLGEPAEAAVRDWVERWWPLVEPGDRVEVGLSRDDAWYDACRRVTDGICVAIDYGHRRESRPVWG